MASDSKFQTPFALKCELCATVAESWHRDLPMPKGKAAGLGYCKCGALAVDSLGIEGKPHLGRVIASNPDAIPLELRDT